MLNKKTEEKIKTMHFLTFLICQKVTHTVFSAPIIKQQTFFLHEMTQKEIIQPVPVDLSFLCHIVPIVSDYGYP